MSSQRRKGDASANKKRIRKTDTVPNHCLQSFRHRQQHSSSSIPSNPTSPPNPTRNVPMQHSRGCAGCPRQHSRGHDKSGRPCVHESHPKRGRRKQIPCPSVPRKEAMACWVLLLPSCRGHHSSRSCSSEPRIFLLASWAMALEEQKFAMTRSRGLVRSGGRQSTHHGEDAPGGVWRGKDRRRALRSQRTTPRHRRAWESPSAGPSVGPVRVDGLTKR